LGYRALVEEVHRHSEATQLLTDLRLQIRKAEHQVRPQSEDPLEVGVQERADPRLLTCFGRTNGEARDADNDLVCTHESQRFCRLCGNNAHAPGMWRCPVQTAARDV